MKAEISMIDRRPSGDVKTGSVDQDIGYIPLTQRLQGRGVDLSLFISQPAGMPELQA